MTISDFLKHTRKQGCIDRPFEGKNFSGVAIEIINPKKNKRYLLQLYKGGEISKTTVVTVCTMMLFIELPKNY